MTLRIKNKISQCKKQLKKNSFLNLVESKLSTSGASPIDDQNDLEDKMIKVFEDHKNQIGKIT